MKTQFIFGFLLVVFLANCTFQTEGSSNVPFEGRIELDISKYEIFTVQQNQYPFENFNTLKDKGFKLRFGIVREPLPESIPITEELFGVKEYIREIVFFLERDKEVIPLGRFSRETGFLDAFGDTGIFFDPNFIENYFFGFPIETIYTPFELFGIAKLWTTGELFRTEIMLPLIIDDETLNLVRFFPVLD